jgi:hypothetical protein
LEEEIMKNSFLIVAAAVAATVAAAGAVALASGGDQRSVAYPEGYRSWTHVKSMVILPGHPLEDPFQGIHHVYANSAAADGLRGAGWSDGAVLVFDLLAAPQSGEAITEGERTLLGVMERDAKRFAATGGWGFEAFAGSSRDKRLVTDGGASCFTCHTAEKDLVFSELRQ